MTESQLMEMEIDNVEGTVDVAVPSTSAAFLNRETESSGGAQMLIVGGQLLRQLVVNKLPTSLDILHHILFRYNAKIKAKNKSVSMKSFVPETRYRLTNYVSGI